MDTDERTWRVGELAEVTGLSVRTLHHYDEIGLLCPSDRSASGHRRYDADDVRRLHRVVALRGFGLTLAEVGQILDGELTDPRELIRKQLEVVEEQLAAASEVKRKLLGVLGGLERADEPSAQALLELIEVMTAMSRALTREEFQELAQSRLRAVADLTAAELEALAEERKEAMAALTPEEREVLRRNREELMPKD
ncbi:MerR family transcriptional regulator [Kribbella sp. NBC_00889]|uniref:MerR family transcriptional regulator n=1 Tax=Kribbella sp. NBC_00889 TaxID=2975974 RepID=UPI003866CF2C|nr:MerR family transcriptional regulator [Kribbella sp. NBC_00889]